MKILIFTEGTILMHKNGEGLSRKEIIKQVKEGDPQVKNYASYIPIGNCVKKLQAYQKQGANIIYLTSRRLPKEISDIKNVLSKYHFPKGKLLFRKKDEEYKDVVERELPDILIEDNCESIGGRKEMVYPYISTRLKRQIKSIVIKEFNGIDHLPEDLNKLVTYKSN